MDIKEPLDANDIAHLVGEYALRLLFDHGSKAMYVVYVADELEEPGLFGKGAVISNLEHPADVKEALYHAAKNYDPNSDIEYVDTEMPQ